MVTKRKPRVFRYCTVNDRFLAVERIFFFNLGFTFHGLFELIFVRSTQTQASLVMCQLHELFAGRLQTATL